MARQRRGPSGAVARAFVALRVHALDAAAAAKRATALAPRIGRSGGGGGAAAPQLGGFGRRGYAAAFRGAAVEADEPEPELDGAQLREHEWAHLGTVPHVPDDPDRAYA